MSRHFFLVFFPFYDFFFLFCFSDEPRKEIKRNKTRGPLRFSIWNRFHPASSVAGNGIEHNPINIRQLDPCALLVIFFGYPHTKPRLIGIPSCPYNIVTPAKNGTYTPKTHQTSISDERLGADPFLFVGWGKEQSKKDYITFLATTG